MIWKRITIILRMICLLLGVGGLLVARYLTKISSSGIEDVPPSFILLACLAGFVFLFVAVIGRYPRSGNSKSIPKPD